VLDLALNVEWEPGTCKNLYADYRVAAIASERKPVHAVGRRVRCGPVGFLESRMWMVVGVVAISTQFEPSGL
jgi:hypothetical protein